MCCYLCFFFFNDTATTEIYTLSLHDALPIFDAGQPVGRHDRSVADVGLEAVGDHGHPHDAEVERLVDGPHLGPDLFADADRKSTRLNSSHANISYAVFCLKKKK